MHYVSVRVSYQLSRDLEVFDVWSTLVFATKGEALAGAGQGFPCETVFHLYFHRSWSDGIVVDCRQRGVS